MHFVIYQFLSTWFTKYISFQITIASKACARVCFCVFEINILQMISYDIQLIYYEFVYIALQYVLNHYFGIEFNVWKLTLALNVLAYERGI